MKFLSRLWPFPGGDVATAHGEEPSLTMAGQLVTLPRPIPLAEREPGPGDLGGFDSNSCWWGHWQDDHWLWIWDCEPVRGETHWLPASVELLPARCCPPEVE